MSALMLLATGGSIIWSLVSFALWVVIMVWIYNIAKRKGRHAFGWLILGFFFWILALILVALLPSKRTTQGYERT